MGLSVVSSQLYNGYAVARYFGNGNIAKGVSAMVLDFLVWRNFSELRL